jgi:transposase
MLKVEEAKAVYLFGQACDMRRGFDRLAEYVASAVGKTVIAGGVFVFLSRDRRRVKILYWDKDGYALWYKRLEAGVFRVELEDGHEELTGVDLKLLLEGLELKRIKFRKHAEQGLYG